MGSRNPLFDHLIWNPSIGRRVDSTRPKKGFFETVTVTDPKLSTYVLGKHGTGKSTLLLNMAQADIRRADKGIVVLDPHGDLARAILLRIPYEQKDRVIYFAPAEQRETPLGLNPFEIHDPTEYEIRAGAVMKVFGHLWYGGDFTRTPTLQNTLETLVRTLLTAYEEHQTHFLHMLLLLLDDPVGRDWRKLVAPLVQDNQAVAAKWLEWQTTSQRKQDIMSTKDKVNHLLSDTIVQRILGQPTSSKCFHFQETLSAKKVLLVNLAGLDKESQRLIGSLILTQILAMAYLRMDEEDRVPCHIYADEFHLFAPQAFVELITQARKFKVFCTIAHQTLAQLTPEVKAAALSCGNIIVFKVNPIDARVLESSFVRDETFPEGGLSELPLYEAMVRVADGRETRQARIETRRERGEENEFVAALIWQKSRAYGRPRLEVEKGLAGLVNTSPLVAHPGQPAAQAPDPADGATGRPAGGTGGQELPEDMDDFDDEDWWE